MDAQDSERKQLDPKVQLPETTWEQREPFYDCVEELLMPGFLSHSLHIAERSLCLRSPQPGDLFLLRQRARRDNRADWVLWSIATCTWMVDGVVLLGSREAPRALYHLYRELPQNVQKLLFSVFLSLFEKMEEASKKLPAFCYEEKSRLLWKQMQGYAPIEETITGIPGSGSLGLNHLQRMWGVYNRVEDLRIQEQYAWNNTKFIASAHAPKGVRQLASRETARLELEEKRRQSVMDNFYYQCIGVLSDEETLADGRKITKATKSVAQLSDEYHRWVAGEQDFHDIVVEDYKRQVIAQYEAEKHRREEDWEKLRAQTQTELEEMETEESAKEMLVGYDLGHLQEILRERGQVAPAVRRVYDSTEGKRRYIYNEFLMKEEVPPPPGGFTLNRDGKPIIPKGDSTLNDQIQQRRFQIGQVPTMTTGDEE